MIKDEEEPRYLAMAAEAEARAEETKTSQAREAWLYVARGLLELARTPDK